MGPFMIPANTKKGKLIFNIFEPIDLGIAITGALITLVLLLIVINNNYESSGFFLNPVFYDTDFVYNKNLRYGEKRVIKDGILGYETDDGIVVVTPVNEVIEIGSGYISSYNGSTTGYGSDCALCSGTVACLTEAGNSYNLINDGVFYDDSTYGSVRVIAADNSLFPCGTVMSIDNGILDPNRLL